MSEPLKQAREDFLAAFLTHVPFDGWSAKSLRASEADLHQQAHYAEALFEDALMDLAGMFNQQMDDEMLQILNGKALEMLKIRQRIAEGVLARLAAYQPHKDALPALLRFYALPANAGKATARLWHSSDLIWRAAGDNATDFNHYSKRVLLSGVLSSTLLFWLGDDSENDAATEAFLQRRIENVMQFGKGIGALKAQFNNLSCHIKPFVRPA